MTPLRMRRLLYVAALIIGSGTVVALVGFALKQNINLFYTPTELLAGQAPIGRSIRVGGYVVAGTVAKNTDLQVKFEVTDFKNKVFVNYQGILPDLFREGQGVVVNGNLNTKGVFIASQVVTKHDANYKPPELSGMQEVPNDS